MIELPVLVAVASIPLSRVVMPFVCKAHGRASDTGLVHVCTVCVRGRLPDVVVLHGPKDMFHVHGHCDCLCIFNEF
jgi:hypothetical protein